MVSRRPRRGSLSAAVAIVLLTLVAACGGERTGGVTTAEDGSWTIRVIQSQYPSLPYSVPWIVGQEHGFFADEGITIEQILGSAGGGDTVRSMLSGEVPFAMVGAAAAVDAVNSGADIVAVAGAVQKWSDVHIVTSRASGITSLHDLQAATGPVRWGFTSPGSTSETALYVLADTFGLPVPERIEPVSTGGVGEALSLLVAGDIDVFALPEPVFSLKKDSLGADLGLVSEHVPWLLQGMAMTSRKVAEEQPELITAVLTAYRRSVRYANEHPEEAGRLWARTAEIPEEVAVAVVTAAVRDGYFGEGEIHEQALKTFEHSLELHGKGSSGVDWSRLVDARFMKELGLDVPDKFEQ